MCSTCSVCSATGTEVNQETIGAAVVSFFVIFGGSLVIGAFFGLLCTYTFKGARAPAHALTLASSPPRLLASSPPHLPTSAPPHRQCSTCVTMRTSSSCSARSPSPSRGRPSTRPRRLRSRASSPSCTPRLGRASHHRARALCACARPLLTRRPHATRHACACARLPLAQVCRHDHEPLLQAQLLRQRQGPDLEGLPLGRDGRRDLHLRLPR